MSDFLIRPLVARILHPTRLRQLNKVLDNAHHFAVYLEIRRFYHE
jgi:hypothetical protein